jgi:hypothetical protein
VRAVQGDRIHSLQGRRDQRRIKRRRGHEFFWAGCIAGAALFLVIALELGRGYRRMQRVNEFVGALDTRSAATIKAELDDLSIGLYDRNPFVRNASVTAFAAATREPLHQAADWGAWWTSNRPTWQYVPFAAVTNSPGLVSPHPYRSALPDRH